MGSATVGAGVTSALNAGFSALVAQAAVQVAGNGGDIGAALQGLASSETVRLLATTMLTAGITSGITTGLENAATTAEQAVGETVGQAASETSTAFITELTDKLQNEFIAAGVRTGVDTAINGGDIGENMIANLQGAAVHALGAQMANEIGAAYKNGDINKASQYIAHAALGGAMDVALGGDGTSGAVGAAVGEATGDLFVETYINDKLTSSTFKSSQEFQKEVLKLQATGVNLARLGAGLAAAVAGGNINIASQTGGNAAKNNALVCTVVAVALASLEVADKAITAYDAWRLAKAVHDGDADTAAEVGAEIALGVATDAIPGDKVGILLGKTLSKVGLFALGTKLVGKYGKDAASRLIRIAEKLPASLDHTVEDLFKNGVTQNEHGISPISRAVDKHAFRAGSVYKPIAGSPDVRNTKSRTSIANYEQQK